MDLTIGALSRRTGVKVPTIRYYEQIGILPDVPRTESNRRVYDETAAKRLAFIRHARDLGFEIEAIRELLALTAEPQASCHAADSIALRRLAEIERRIEQLVALRAELRRMVEECGHGRVCDCRVIETLADHALCRDQAHSHPP